MSAKNLALILSLLFLTGCGVSQPSQSSLSTTGPQGPTGPAGTPGLIFLNAYNPAISYVATDVVTYQGSTFVALTSSTGVLPVGSPSSTADWAVLAQAGANGTPGVAGPVGPPGPVGATGPAGPQGPQFSYLNGKRLGVQGDSISSIFNNAWQNVVLARTGMTLTSQDARPGRTLSQAFECYGAITPGATLGVYHTDGSNCTNYGGTSEGNTLAQNVANVDILIVELGTNDIFEQVGSLGDPVTAGTVYGSLRWICETYLTANPSMRLVLVTNQFETGPPVSEIRGVANAEEDYGHSMGIPVINMFNLGGVNSITAATLLRDGLHPSDFGFSHFYGPVIAQELLRLY